MVKRIAAIAMVFLMLVSSVLLPAYANSSDAISDNKDYVGPGKHETELYIKNKSNTDETEELINVGKASMWNTREQFIVNIETKDNWNIAEVSIYVGVDSIPTSIGGAPKLTMFPYQEHFSNPVNTYELALDLVDDLDFTWGKRDKSKRIQNIAIFAKLVGEDEQGNQVTHEKAWAYGEDEFESNWGWWTQYAMDHPQTGHFIDSPVSGVSFNTGSNKGRTDDSGSFDYISGETVTLSIGQLTLGTTTAKHKISPLDLVGTDNIDDQRVINMARLLQSLDVDGDSTRNITITDSVTDSLQQAMEELSITELDFNDSDSVEALIESTVAKSSGKDGVHIKNVSSKEARDNLEKGISSTIFRKNVSKTAEFINTKAKLELMPVYVPARTANGEPAAISYYDSVYDEDGNYIEDVLIEQRPVAKPLVAVYTDEVEDTGASDVFAAISRDEGATWQRKNLSKSADKSSFKLKNGAEYPGDVRKPQVRVRNNNILVAWTSKYAKTGKPTYAIKTDDEYIPDDPYYEEDIWGVSGPQRSVDYTDEGYPEVGEIPFSVVWTCRGTIDTETGEIIWYKPERLTSGRRDAFQLMFTGAPNAGFALVWQEDPEGLRPGEQAGPGEGWSGATTNHKTDIWYSYIKWGNFQTIDENFVSNGSSQHTEDEPEDEEIKGRLKSLVPFSLPVRISDNDTVNYGNMQAEYSEISDDDLAELEEGETIAVEGGEWTAITTTAITSGKSDKDNKSTDDNSKSSENNDKLRGTHQYGYEIDGLCEELYCKVNNQGERKYVAVTEDGRLLDGNTGASRPNIMVQPYKKSDGSMSAWVVVCYEETKGLGAGPPEDTGSSNDEIPEQDDSLTVQDDSSTAPETTSDPVDVDLNDVNKQGQKGSFTAFSTYRDQKTANTQETVELYETTDEDENEDEDSEGNNKKKDEDASGEQRGKNTYVADNGKNVIYHSFDMQNPDLVSAGHIINPQVEGIEGNPGVIDGLQYLVDENDILMYDWHDDPIPAYENARRPRLLIQPKNAALKGKMKDDDNEGDPGTVLVMVYKMGEEGKGRPSDIFMRRWVITYEDKGNPYDTNNLLEENRNISSVSVVETWENPENDEDSKGDGIKVLKWTQSEANYLDTSGLNPYDDARAHRGILRGDKLAIAYDWTPNWAAARNGNDVFNLYVRRSFDGGETFTTNPKGTNEVYIDEVLQGIGVKHTDTFKLDDTKESHEKISVETFYAAGDFEPSRNLSQIQNTKTSVIEPRLVGGPGTIKTDDPSTVEIETPKSEPGFSYPQDTRDINSFWVTYGIESNPGKNSDEPGGPLDLFYSYTTDFGDTYYEETKEIKTDSDGNHGGEEKVVWDWLAKDTGQKEAAQAECQIRMTPDGSIFYSVWNETGEDGSDVMFRRIMRDGGSIDSGP